MTQTLDFGLTEQQEELRGLARTILDKEVTLELLGNLDSSGEWFARGLWKAFAGAGLLGIAIPEEQGGLGFGYLDLCLLLREIGRSVAPVPAVPTLVSAALPIAAFGTPEQQARWLPGVASGETVLTAALPEWDATTARPDGDSWRLDGVKIAVPFAAMAAAVLVPARTDDGRALLALVAPDAAGVSLESARGLNGEPQATMRLEDVAVSIADVLGAPDDGTRLRWTVDRTTVGLCALAAGVTERAVRIAAEYTTTRHQFGHPIGTFQAVGQRLADAFIDVQGIELTMLQAASHLDEHKDVPIEVATAKFWAAEGGNRVGHAVLHVHGGISIDLDYPIHRYFLWAKQIEFSLGAATPQLLCIGKILADAPA